MNPNEFHPHGFLPEETPDPRHWNVEELGLTTSLPSRVDLRQYASPVTNQGSTGACVAHAVVNALEMVRIKKRGIKAHVDLSPLALYYRTREHYHPEHVNKDTGSFISHACAVLKKMGVPPLSMHNNSHSYKDRPSLAATQIAWPHRSGAYYRIKSDDEERIHDVKRALADGYPVVYGTKVDAQWFGYRRQAILEMPDEDKIQGGHATCLVGYSPGYDLKTVFIGKNSWGTSWGDNGYYYIRDEVIGSHYARDFWVITDY